MSCDIVIMVKLSSSDLIELGKMMRLKFTTDNICKHFDIHPNTLTRYKKKIRAMGYDQDIVPIPKQVTLEADLPIKPIDESFDIQDPSSMREYIAENIYQQIELQKLEKGGQCDIRLLTALLAVAKEKEHSPFNKTQTVTIQRCEKGGVQFK